MVESGVLPEDEFVGQDDAWRAALVPPSSLRASPVHIASEGAPSRAPLPAQQPDDSTRSLGPMTLVKPSVGDSGPLGSAKAARLQA